MDRSAYPEIGQRITISQGTEPAPSPLREREATRTRDFWIATSAFGLLAMTSASCTRAALARSRRVDDKLVVGPLRWGERVLDETHGAVVRVIEHAKAPFADLNGLLIPGFCKEGALATKRLDEYLNLSVAKGAREVGAKFREQPSRSVLPVGNELTRSGLEERIAQEVALTIAVQPAVKEPRRRFVPAAGVPEAVEAIGRVFDRFDGGDQRGGRVGGRPARSFRIEPSRKLEQIVVFSARQRERSRNAAESLGGGLHRPPLLDPRAPGHADPGERGEFLAPKTGGAPPAGRRPWPYTLTVSANEFAEESPLIRFKHSSHCNRIRFKLVTV